VRDLRVQEFLRDLVRVATSSDLAGSIIVELFHCSEGRDVEQVGRSLKQFSRVCDCSFSLFIHLCLYILHAHIVHIFTCLILFVLN